MKDWMSSAQPSPKPTHVLLVEDNQDAREITAEALRAAGCLVDEADAVASAQEAASRARPDVVVLDCRLPDGDGLDLVTRWRQDETMKDVPVIVLTAFYARQDMEAALLAGADAFLVKPCPASVLTMQIASLRSGQRPSRTLRKPV